MRHKIKLYNSLKCSGSFLNDGHISRSDYRVSSTALLNNSTVPTISNTPCVSNIPQRDLHFILRYLSADWLEKITGSNIQTLPSSMRHRYFLFQYHKNFQLVRRLKGSALCLLQTKYAIKPKNPE